MCGPGRSMRGHEWARTRGDVWTGAGRVPSRRWCECRSCRGPAAIAFVVVWRLCRPSDAVSSAPRVTWAGVG